jgi:transketolase
VGEREDPLVTTELDEGRSEQVQEVRDRAATVRRETIRLVGIAKSGHYSSVFSCAEIMAALYSGVMRIAEDPEWPERDRLILSKGHVAIGLYPLLAERGYFPEDWLDSYTRLGSPLGDHPDMRLIPGVDFSSGSLGHGLSVGVGMAKAARLRGYDETRIWVMLGDQELNEGQVWEAAGSASHFGLGNLVAIVDANQMGLDGMTEETMSVEPIAGRFEAFGWDVVEIDGHDPEAILAAAADLPPPTSDRPRCILARTVKGKGVSYMELSRTWHIGYLSPDDSAAAVAEIDRRG